MEEKKAREYLQVNPQHSHRATGLNVPPKPRNAIHSFYEEFAIRGIQVDAYQPGFISCTLIVPPHLIDRNGFLAVGAIANLVDKIGSVVLFVKDVSLNVSVDMSISYLSTAKLNDELEITAKVIGEKGAYNGAVVILKNKATREMIAEGRHSMFCLKRSKI
uniref:acyl-coenzyme A thioesterase 13-like n=1 Tax=Erigeron canadensis TaxID=72917 RepID=UPI001CB8A0B0|nr:acyl-coenzyme A thioesterase 13-like [Erigeron canadensis]